ncbi:putative bifunctional diguanylate cyclase/phosphodiesterase [Kineococcus rhizosphaerae]|uniref:PAS domain S-box-containing protein/diguanylate cyclase (GGDEF)-like protein n=1 Tax=Kineococcus rhizosphaerae TaxID=559628 RepID=A0A2T0R6R4_9ACTN|nr:EAL domain-containing protein [Kineococcus rhizosphaerae]PRY16857.1 PAS domain S-box-containing protein/diguanylate cyclase (GGDEF)-like protein [Kineococcus rhizosphaerae]
MDERCTDPAAEVERLRAQLDAERRQAASERANLVTLLENIPTGICEFSDENSLVWANRAFRDMVGLGMDRLTGDGWRATVHPDDAGIPARAVRTPGGLRAGIRHVDVDGGIHHCDSTVVLLTSTDAQGREVVRPLVNVHEVTPIHHATEAALAEERRFRALFDSSPIGIAVSDGQDVVSDLNPAWARMLRVDPALVLGRVFQEVHPPFAEALDREAIRAGLAADGRYEWQGWMPRFDGTRFWAHLVVSYSVDALGNPVVVSQVQDHDEVHRGREALAHAARHDILTDLPNRASILETLQGMLTRTADGPEQVGVLFCDLDRFKVVNDSLGHAAGDELLVAVADRLRAGLREGDHVGRLGGDEFVVLLDELTGPQDAVRVAERLRASLEEDVDLAGHPVRCGISIGIALSDPDGPPATAAALLRDADTAMYRAKNRSRGGFQLFAPAMHEEAVARLELEDDLRRAVEQDEFVVHYQPIARLEDGARMAFEALVRWQHPERGTLGPETFLDAAVECGLTPAIDSSVLNQVATFLVTHPTEIVAVNVSAQRLDGTFGDAVARALARVGAAGYRLMVELRESALLTDDTQLAAELHDLESLGVTVIVDDFGTGSSVLTSLHELPVRGLKMGTAFTAGLPGNRRMVASILGLADGLDVECIATGVETAEQAQFLREAGWHAAQGWFFGGVAPESHWFPVVLPLD